ncbi:sulfatase-like hydrolase/transferase [uncultured Thiohalocapsa sp.]|uniref:sulfatase-like hydrolase/transferase n=1 Tax=uncultured Thiohalocapsa sp. TaxID=768990 RepID=UPI0025CEDB0D|nr:sulfatase-like hydrolase/transferase [uncultured Thiohalocapsa sp.]
MIDRRRFTQLLAGSIASVGLLRNSSAEKRVRSRSEKPNVVLITVDDLSAMTNDIFGHHGLGYMPNLKAFADVATTYLNGHVLISECFPSRTSILTGRVPHRHGQMTFGGSLKPRVTTLPEILARHGYYVGLMGKLSHTIPSRHDAIDHIVDRNMFMSARSPERFAHHVEAIITAAHAQQRPFCILANIEDPHRPWAGSPEERTWSSWLHSRARAAVRGLGLEAAYPDIAYSGHPDAKIAVDPDTVFIPPYLHDLPEVRAELASYYTSCMRADRSFQAILDQLRTSGDADNTLIIFLTDNGLAMPLGKGNVYRHSTLASLMIAYPGHPELAGKASTEYVRAVDLLPTVLDLLDIAAPEGLDGTSLLRQAPADLPRDRAFTYRHQYPMRAVHDGAFSYIYNHWALGDEGFQRYLTNNPTGRAIEAGAGADPDLERLWSKIHRRQPEELYHAADRYSLNEISAQEPTTVQRYRHMMLTEMRRTQDPLTSEYATYAETAPSSGAQAPPQAESAAM